MLIYHRVFPDLSNSDTFIYFGYFNFNASSFDGGFSDF
jgi:hypothetical protein